MLSISSGLSLVICSFWGIGPFPRSYQIYEYEVVIFLSQLFNDYRIYNGVLFHFWYCWLVPSLFYLFINFIDFFPKKQLLILLIFSIVSVVSILFIHALYLLFPYLYLFWVYFVLLLLVYWGRNFEYSFATLLLFWCKYLTL